MAEMTRQRACEIADMPQHEFMELSEQERQDWYLWPGLLDVKVEPKTSDYEFFKVTWADGTTTAIMCKPGLDPIMRHDVNG